MSALPSTIKAPTTLSQAVAAPDFVKMNADHSAEMAAEKTRAETERQPYADAVDQQQKSLDAKISSPAPSQPLPENTAKHLDPKQLNDAASMYMTLGALAGLMTRTPMTSALGNMTAAMQGAMAGDEQQFNRAYQAYQDDYKRAMTTNKAMLDEREKVIKDESLSLTDKINQLKLIDRKNGAIPQEMETSYKNRVDAQYKQMELTRKTEDAHSAVQARVEAAKQAHADRMAEIDQRAKDRAAFAGAGARGGAGGSTTEQLTPAGLKVAEELTRAGRPLPGGWSKQGMSRGNSILNALGAEQEGGAGSGSIVAGRAQYGADSASLSFQQKRIDAIEAGTKKIANDIHTVDSYIKPGNLDYAKVVNKLGNSLRSAASDPTLAPYALAVKQVATEYERQMQGGLMSVAQLHAGAQEQAQQILNENMTIAEVNAVLPVMLREIENNRKAAHDTLGEIQARMKKGASVMRSTDPKPIASDADYNALPSGAEFIAPDGSHRRKP